MNKSRSIKLGTTILSVAVAGAFAASQPSPTPPAKAASPTPQPKSSATPPAAKLDAKTKAELLQAEDRFIVSIQNGDAKSLEALLADYYADAFGNAEKAINKRGAIARVSAGRLHFYRVEKEPKLSVSAGTFTVEGLAKDATPKVSEVTPKEEWVHVRRLWIKPDDRWLLVAQMIMPKEQWEEEEKRDAESNQEQSKK
jgi:hypothetical protein